MRFFIFITTILTVSAAVAGQGRSGADPLSRLQQMEMSGDVVITLDSLILENYNKHLIQNSRNRGVSGYRIRIFSDNGHGAKEKQRRVKADFLSTYPDITTYDRYEGSYYKIYVGDFRTRREALKVLNRIKSDFHDAFIVGDNIVIED
ncbi:MAG: SPOR domain-containing protein [Bacteroidales bacterium]